jgi:cobalt/nickel transport protein
MNSLLRSVLALALAGLLAPAAGAHFNMLLPDKASVKKGETVTFTYQWGHPFEHQLFDAPAPQGVSVLHPDGEGSGDLRGTLKEIKVPGEDKKVTAYQFRYTPQERGDFVFTLGTPPIWMGEEKRFFEDSVKVVLHVQAQRGWDDTSPLGGFRLRPDLRLRPLTRPYGLEPGMVFQAQALDEGKPQAGGLIEVERYNPAPPKELPPDEHITRTAKTDPNGVVTCTLTDPGWWCITAERDGGNEQHEGKSYPVRLRSTLWVFVDEKATSK